jgi:hypothetical protein
MKRLVLFVVLVTCLAATPAFAAGPDAKSTIKYDFSARSAGIVEMAQTSKRPDLRRAAPAPVQVTGGKSFWKTPWPYVIGGGVVVMLVVISQTKEGGLY